MKKLITTAILILLSLFIANTPVLAMTPEDKEVMFYEGEPEIAIELLLELEEELAERENEIIVLSKLLWGEARGVDNTAEQAGVVWCVLNRTSSDRYSNDIVSVSEQHMQFTGYNRGNPVTEDMRAIVEDVMIRWMLEKRGFENVGRTLPNDYLFFAGRRGHNWFRKEYEDRTYWDWEIEDPYDNSSSLSNEFNGIISLTTLRECAIMIDVKDIGITT